MSTLRDWMTENNINTDKALCMSIGTDGFKAGRDNIMSLSFAGEHVMGGGHVTYFIEGADLLKPRIVEVTGVTEAYYQQRALGMKRAQELFLEYVLDSSCLITYSLSKFHGRWIEECPDCIRALPALDITNVYKLHDNRDNFPFDLDTITSLDQRLDSSYKHMSKGWSFGDICKNNLPHPREYMKETITEQRIEDLWLLWTVALDRRTA